MTDKFIQKYAPELEKSPTILASTTSDLVEVIQIGTRRKRFIDLEPGMYAASAKEVFSVKKRIRVFVEEEFRFTHESIRNEPAWHVVMYDFTKAVDLDAKAATKAPAQSWWTRLWNQLRGKSKVPAGEAELPAARLLEHP